MLLLVPQVVGVQRDVLSSCHKMTAVHASVCSTGDHPSRKGWIWLHHLLRFACEGAGCWSRQVMHVHVCVIFPKRGFCLRFDVIYKSIKISINTLPKRMWLSAYKWCFHFHYQDCQEWILSFIFFFFLSKWWLIWCFFPLYSSLKTLYKTWVWHLTNAPYIMKVLIQLWAVDFF